MNLAFRHVFWSHQKSQHHEILSLGVIWANLKHDEAPYGPVLKTGWISASLRKTKPSAISTHMTMTFWRWLYHTFYCDIGDDGDYITLSTMTLGRRMTMSHFLLWHRWMRMTISHFLPWHWEGGWLCHIFYCDIEGWRWLYHTFYCDIEGWQWLYHTLYCDIGDEDEYITLSTLTSRDEDAPETELMQRAEVEDFPQVWTPMTSAHLDNPLPAWRMLQGNFLRLLFQTNRHTSVISLPPHFISLISSRVHKLYHV